MLVLSRKLGERILVPDCKLAVTVVAIRGDTVRLGVSAPGELSVYREEVWCRIRQRTCEAPAEPQGGQEGWDT